MRNKSLALVCAAAALSWSAAGLRGEETKTAGDLPALKIQGDGFVDASGHVVKFWGVNLVGLYPEHATADAIAANLASLQVNLARPHHILRPSSDWNPSMTSGALLTYKGNSREFDPVALDRFDYLNAALRHQGIYLSFSVNWTRRYLAGDFDIVPGDEQERASWVAAMKQLNDMPWKKAMDVYKMLPTIDERSAKLNEEFIKKFLAHVNPFTGLSYAQDPQVLTFEVMNESSVEYSIICGNRLPDYWQGQLLGQWKAFAEAAGIEPGDLYKPANPKAKEIRARFLSKLDEAYFERIKKAVREAGCKAPMTFSNLWRGDNMAGLNYRVSDWVEDHNYMDPLVVKKASDGFYDLSKSALAGKPFFVGELNQGEGEKNIAEQSPYRSMLPVATSAYASLQNWSGITWFAWTHGEQNVGADGWAKNETRTSNIGQMVGDGMMVDHIRTTGMIFRRGLIKPSTEPVTLWVDEPFWAGNYSGLMEGKYNYKPGWQDIHGIRKAFGPAPKTQSSESWMKQAPPNPLVSDTGEIVKDIERKQLTVTAPKVEAFSGNLDTKPPAGLPHLTLEGEGFATVVMVSAEEKALPESTRLILSRTAMDAKNAEVDGPSLKLQGLKQPVEGQTWQFLITRPRSPEGSKVQPLTPQADGSLILPAGTWHEGELSLTSTQS